MPGWDGRKGNEDQRTKPRTPLGPAAKAYLAAFDAYLHAPAHEEQASSETRALAGALAEDMIDEAAERDGDPGRLERIRRRQLENKRRMKRDGF